MRWFWLAPVSIVACTPAAAPVTRSQPATTIAPPPATSEEPSEPPARKEPPPDPSLPRNAKDAPPTRVDELGDRVPVSFVAKDMLTAMDPQASHADSTLHILAWTVEVDDRPLVVDRAIVWVHHHPAKGTASWQLAHFYRHPLDSPPNNERWHVAMVYDVPYVGQKSFSSAPTGKDLDAFFKETWWHFQPSGGFQFLDKGVNKYAWRAAIGTDPHRAF